jgi:3-phenylpropionate/trans-cinnamate dioxygenase ferredoxin subunit
MKNGTIALCRCGGSTTKPFCDGKHSERGFEGAERAVRLEGDCAG